MIVHGMKRVGAVCLLAILVPGMTLASTDFRRPPGERRRPPQEAFDICKDKSEGEAVELSTPNGTIKAACKSIEGQLVAVPEGAPPPPQKESSTGQ